MTSASHDHRVAGLWSRLLAVPLLALSAGAVAQEQGCVELTSSAATEVTYLNSQGRAAKRLVPAARIVPGDEVVWTITAKNVCGKPVDTVVIANPVPQHTRFVAGSASGERTAITYSLDGREFMPAGSLTVQEADGTTRPARPEEYRYVRWQRQGALPPGATALVRYRAIVI